MPRLDAHIALPKLSILDRLLVDAEEPAEYHEAVARVANSVRTDLACLLNARTRSQTTTDKPEDPDESFPSLDGTIARFGIPDMTNLDLKHGEDCEELSEWITSAIEAFEPRLTSVTVDPVRATSVDPESCFAVDATLDIEPETTDFDAQTVVHWRNRRVEIKSATTPRT